MSVRQRFDLATTRSVSIASGGIDLFIQRVNPAGPWIPVASFSGPVELTATATPDGYAAFLVAAPDCVVAPVSEATAVDLTPAIATAVAQHGPWIAAEEHRLDTLAASRSGQLLASTDALALVMDQPDAPVSRPQGSLEALTQAMEPIGEFLRVAFRTELSGEVLFDPVTELANGAGCRARPVNIGGKWWPAAIEPVLAFMGDDRHPVACIPSGNTYRVHDPITGTVSPIEDVADLLDPEGYAFTRPLPPKGTTTRGMLKFAFGNAKSALRALLLAGFLAGVAGLATPLITTLFYDLVIPQQSVTMLLSVLVLLLGAAAAVGLLLLTQNIALLRIEGVFQQELEPSMWNHMLRLPAGFFRQFTTGDLVNRVQGIDIIRQLIGGSVLAAFITAIFSVVNLAFLFLYDATLALITLAIASIVVALLVFLNIRNIRNQRAGFTASGRLFGFVFQMLGGVSKIRVAGAEAQMVSRWEILFRENQLYTYRSGRVRVWTTAITACFGVLITTVVVIYGGIVLRDQLSDGVFMGFLAAAGAFTAAIAAMTFSFGPLGACVPLFERLMPIIQADPEQPLDAVDPGRLDGRVSMHDVTFRYTPEAPDAVTDISFSVAPGEFLAITGPSGSGKSTILKLLLGLEVPQSGSVTYDGQPLDQLDRPILRRQIGVVMQEARPMPGPIIGAIVGDSGCSEQDAWDAATKVNIADAIHAMPMGMHTMISAGTGQVSGGQLQRILLARAIVTKPRIVYLDEATSALDNTSQDIVARTFNDMDVTRVVIAHRLSTIRAADRILVIDAGRIVQSGTYDELVAQEGLFRTLVDRQTSEALPPVSVPAPA